MRQYLLRFSIALVVLLVGFALLPETRGIVVGYFRTEEAIHVIRTNFNFKNPSELFVFHGNALFELEKRHSMWSEPMMGRVVDALITDADGRPKPWVTPGMRDSLIVDFREDMRYSEWMNSGVEERASANWRFQPQQSTAKVISVLVTAGTLGWFWLVLLPWLIMFALASLIMWGKGGPINSGATDHHTVIPSLESPITPGAGIPVASPSDTISAETPTMPWPIIMGFVIVALLTDLRQRVRCMRPIGSRAPPSLERGQSCALSLVSCFSWSSGFLSRSTPTPTKSRLPSADSSPDKWARSREISRSQVHSWPYLGPRSMAVNSR